MQFERFQQQRAQKLANIARLDAGLGQIEGIKPQLRHPEEEAPGYLYMFYYDAQAFNGLPRYLFVKALEAERDSLWGSGLSTALQDTPVPKS